MNDNSSNSSSNNSNDKKYDNERRQYYRIDDSAIFTYQVVNKEQEQEQEQEQELDSLATNNNGSAAFEMMELFGQMSQQMKGALGRISDNSADMASYLKSLDNKIDLLAQMCLFKEHQSDQEPPREINLGAGGLAFGCDEKLRQGTLLTMKLILSTDLLCLHLTGRVIQVSNHKDGDFPYRISVGFTDISDTEVDQIIKHIMRLQSEQLRCRRESRNM